MRLFAPIALAAALAACSPPPAKAPDADTPPVAAAPAAPVDIPAGEYKLDKAHASLVFSVSHIGFSNYTGSFRKFDATLQLDPTNLAGASVVATVDPASLEVPAPPAGFLAELKGPQWLDAARFKDITFRSTKVEPTGPDTARITGDFTLHGVTLPLVLEAKYNGGYRGHPMEPNARVGFSATGTIKRSAHGIAYGVPAPGTTMGVGDDVKVVIEAEFSGPPLPPQPEAKK